MAVDDHKIQTKGPARVPLTRDYPGFDSLRIVAALSVVFSHSFLLAETNERGEPSGSSP